MFVRTIICLQLEAIKNLNKKEFHMEYEQVINGRRSARGYKQESVPKEVLEEVIALATRAPSSMNTQPWHFHVVTGDALDNIRKENTKRNIEAEIPAKRVRPPELTLMRT